MDVHFGENGAVRSHIFFGDPLRLSAKLDELPDLPIGFTVAIKKIDGRRLSLFSTNPHDGVTFPKGKRVNVSFTIEFCPLAPGEYYIDMAVTEPGVRIIDEVANVIRFEVLPSRIGGSLSYDSRLR